LEYDGAFPVSPKKTRVKRDKSAVALRTINVPASLFFEFFQGKIRATRIFGKRFVIAPLGGARAGLYVLAPVPSRGFEREQWNFSN